MSSDERSLGLISQQIAWNETATDYPRESSVHRLFEAQAAKTPDAIAVLNGIDQVTYSDLNHRANRLAHYLGKQLVSPETLVGIALNRSISMIEAMLGVLKCGAAYLPLDTNYPAERLKILIDDARPGALITESARSSYLAFSDIPVIHIDEKSREIDRENNENPDLQTSAEGLAYVMYTSGSTGIPKGVEIQHRGIVRLVRNTNYVDFAAGDVVAQIANPSFDAITFEVWGALLNGARLVILPADVILSPARLAEAIREQQISTMFLTAPLFRLVATMAPHAFATMKTLVAGGDAVDPDAARKVLRTAPPSFLVNGYGPTEATTFSVCHLIQDVPEGATSIPIGKPISNSQAYILDSDLRPVAVGEPGELCLGGDGIARGYLNRPELNAERFVANPFDTGRSPRLYRTGDVARYRSDGVIEFLGRVDRQIKLRGFRIELGEIETALRQHPRVVDCAVILADGALAAYAVTSGDVGRDSRQLRHFLSVKLPEFMVPATIVILDALPLTPSGKLDRKALPAFEPAALKTAEVLDESLTESQSLVRGVWRKVCGIEASGLDDNFFDLGGDSLQLAEVEAELRSCIDPTISIVDLFKSPTIRSLSRRLEKGAEVTTSLRDARERARKQSLAFHSLRSAPAPGAAIPGAETR